MKWSDEIIDEIISDHVDLFPPFPRSTQRELETSAIQGVVSFLRAMQAGDSIMVERRDPAGPGGLFFMLTVPIDPIVKNALAELELQRRVDRHMDEIKARMAG